MIKIICVGKLKEQYLIDAIKEYQKRITKYDKLNIIELLDEKTTDKKVALRKESKAIEPHLNPKDYVVVLDINAKEINSLEFAQLLNDSYIKTNTITFIIGSSYGLDDSIKERANLRLSFSKLTFPHQLFRVILLEQIYRGFKIINNETYHK